MFSEHKGIKLEIYQDSFKIPKYLKIKQHIVSWHMAQKKKNIVKIFLNILDEMKVIKICRLQQKQCLEEIYCIECTR